MRTDAVGLERGEEDEQFVSFKLLRPNGAIRFEKCRLMGGLNWNGLYAEQYCFSHLHYRATASSVKKNNLQIKVLYFIQFQLIMTQYGNHPA